MTRWSRNLDDHLAAPMYFMSVTYLVLLGGALHLDAEAGPLTATTCLTGLALLYPAFIVELILRMRGGEQRWRQYLLFSLLPPLRMGARDQESGGQVWLPRSGWSTVDRALHHRVSRAFSGPMIVIALLIVPVLVCEFSFQETVLQNSLLGMALDLGTAVIWIAFAFEFIIMVSIVNTKIRYCKEHWIDLAIICLPLLAAARLLRLNSLIRLNKLFRTARVYRLRGVMMRAYRGLLILDVLYRLGLLKLEGRLTRLRRELELKEEEVAHLRQSIAELEAQVEVPNTVQEPAQGPT